MPQSKKKVVSNKKSVNKVEKKSTTKTEIQKPLQNEVIAFRSDPKDTRILEIIFVVIGVLLVGFCITFLALTKFLTETKDMFLKIITPIAGVVGLLNLYVSIDCLMKIQKNRTTKKECIIYNQKEKVIIFNNLKGKETTIKLEQFEKVSSGPFSIYKMFGIQYKNESGKSRIEYLGWSFDEEKTNKRINELKK